MGSEQYLKRARREPRTGKVDALLDAKLKGVEWGEFRLGDLFEKINLRFKKSIFDKDKDISKKKSSEFNLPLINAKDGDNGIMYYGREKDFESIKMSIDIVNDGAISTGNVYSQPQKTGVLYNAYLIKPKFGVNEKLLHFLTSTTKKSIKHKFGYENKAGWTKVKIEKIQLPTKNGKIDFEFMENFIAELEAQKIARLEAYLVENGLKEYRLSQEEEAVLRDFESGNIEWGEFKIGDLFEKLNLKTHKKPFDKVKDTSSIPTDEFSLPLVNAKFGNNGVMFYGREEDFDSAEMTIDIISNGAIATGTVYAQPHKTGVLWDAYLLKAVVDDITKNKLLYLSTSIEKSIKLKFGWDNKAVWSKVQHKLFSLPTKNNQPDYALMQTLISAVQKLVVKDVVLYVESKKGKRI